jgi:hypothetical protein
MNLQLQIDNLYLPSYKLNLDGYHSLLQECVNNREFAATVFVYDHLLTNGFKANKTTFSIIEAIHSKTIPENNNIHLKLDLKKKLAPRRRIHKIIKGANYSDNYESAKIYMPKVRAFIAINPELKTKGRIGLAKTISNGCHISFNDARYIITALKREGYLDKDIMGAKNKGKNPNVKTLDNFFTITSTSK